jgi:hypothetical protein
VKWALVLAAVACAHAQLTVAARPTRAPTLVDCRVLFDRPEESHVRTRTCVWAPVHRHLIRLTDDSWIVLAPPST